VSNKLKTVSERKAEKFIVGTLMAIREGNKKAAMGGLLTLFRHLEAGGDLPQTLVTNILDEGQR